MLLASLLAHGHPFRAEDAVLQSSSARAVISAEKGRVMFFGPKNGPNLLWTDSAPADAAWKNWGGDKLWTAPQSDWNWPPVLAHDGRPHTLTVSGDSAVLQSQADARGLRFIRRFRLEGTTLRVENELVNDGLQACRVAIWQITQIPPVKEIRFKRTVSATFPQGWSAYPNIQQGATTVRAEGGELVFRPSYDAPQKYGMAASDGTLRARVGGYWLSLSHPFRPLATYPDEGKAQQVFIGASPRYTELEVNAPLEEIPPGGRQRMVTSLSFRRIR